LKIFNETARSVDQGGGKRKGSFAVYLEPWHADIESFLELRKNTGAEEFRARELFYALWIPDLFMQRVEEDGEWTLMSEHECPGLSDTYGNEFVELYTRYEKEFPDLKRIKARALMSKIIEAQIETGQPYMLYKDAVNNKSNQKNIGVIKSSNLCAEIVEYSEKDETAVCNLASIALPKFVTEEGKYDYQDLYQVAKLATKNLDQVIDINFYPTDKTENSNSRHRPIGLGIQGLADVYFKMNIAYDSVQAQMINKQIFETIYFGALEASMELASDKGAYSTFKGSPLSQGQFQFDLWGVKPSSMWDWKGLMEKIQKHGVRNSLTTACMPTASTGIILGNTETFQVQTSNIYKRQTLSGEFLLVNRHLVKELMKRDLWSKELRDQIILENGSVQNIEGFPEDLKDVYKTVWETSQKTVIDMSADRAPFIDQTQSMNLWLSTPTFGKVNSMHMYAWKKGLKTGMYYLRSRSAVDAVKVTVSSEKKAKESYVKETQSNEPEDCITCSA
jgi:ribonucleoside-diphosphate reductase alpha subunit